MSSWLSVSTLFFQPPKQFTNIQKVVRALVSYLHMKRLLTVWAIQRSWVRVSPRTNFFFNLLFLLHKNGELTQPKTTSAVSYSAAYREKLLVSQISRSPPRVSWSPSFVHGSVTVTTVGYAIDFPLLGFATAIIITVLIYSANQSDNLETHQRRLNNLSVWKSLVLPLLVSSFLHREPNDAKAESLQMADE